MARHAILQVSLDFIVTACKVDNPNQFFTVRVKENGLPLDAEIVTICHPSYGTALSRSSLATLNQVGLVLYSPSFEDIPAGQPLPILPPPVFERQEWEFRVNILKEVAQTP